LLTDWLNETGLILHYPYLERTGVIAAYLACPFLFIYSRNTFYPGRLWRRRDWLLLIPALVYIIDFMPFFLLSAEKKNAIWRENLGNLKRMLLAREGWLGSSGFYFAFIYVWIFLIMYFQFRLIARNWKVKNGFRSVHNRRLLYFIVMISLLYLPLFIPGIFGVLFKLSWFNDRFIGFSFGLTLTAIAVYLLVYPNILYGFIPEVKFSYRNVKKTYKITLPQSELLLLEDEVKPTVIEIPEYETNDANQEPVNEVKPAELALVLEHMEKEKPFRQQGFAIQDLSNQIGIPVYQLSPLINGYFKMNFTSWVNRYRVDYFLEHARENRNMTLEAVAKDAGFTSRSTFIAAFKKEKGVTPREYLRDLKM
jgi:AraC-like DNA-binding protein